MDVKENSTIALQEKPKNYASSATETATKHRIIFLFIILGAAISFALIRTQSYLNIGRNQTRYDEETAQIRYQKIDEEKLQAYEQEQQDKQIEVSSQFDPNRDNPFTD